MRSVQTDESQTYAYENGLMFMETSAKTSANVTEIFKAIGMKWKQFNKQHFLYFKFNCDIFNVLAEKLPKNENSNTSGQGRRLVDSAEGSNKSLSSCCKWYNKPSQFSKGLLTFNYPLNHIALYNY